jgi:hypothetical protein
VGTWRSFFINLRRSNNYKGGSFLYYTRYQGREGGTDYSHGLDIRQLLCYYRYCRKGMSEGLYGLPGISRPRALNRSFQLLIRHSETPASFLKHLTDHLLSEQSLLLQPSDWGNVDGHYRNTYSKHAKSSFRTRPSPGNAIVSRGPNAMMLGKLVGQVCANKHLAQLQTQIHGPRHTSY